MDLGNLNEQQKAAVEHFRGPCCVIAGAGSGKTRVLTMRIARLVERGVNPGNILAVTFTRKAAGEMLERLETLMGSAVEDLTVGTFHSVCYRIVREEYHALGRPVPSAADDSWKKRAVRRILAAPGPNNPDGMNWDLDLSYALAWLSQQKNNLIGPEDKLMLPAGREYLEPKYRTLYRLYERAKATENKLDFDDMLLWCWRLLKDNPAIRSKWQERFRWILVDEFQDTNLAQHEILKLLAPPENNVFAVGDDYQAIYGWREAKVDFMLQFEEIWPGARILRLETNYRSVSNIVEASNRLIAHNTKQLEKVCRSHRGSGLDPIYMSAEDEDDEARAITEEIAVLVGRDGIHYGDIAILYRTNAQSRAFEDEFTRRAVPHVVVGSVGFYNRKEVKDILAYLRLAADPGDDEAAKRVLNVPSRYLGRAFVQAAERYAAEKGLSFLEAIASCPESRTARYREAREFVSLVERLRSMSDEVGPGELVQAVRKLTRYDEWLAREEGTSDEADSDKIENLNALAVAASKFPTLESFLDYAERLQQKPDQENGDQDRVRLMTIHKAKGLEFPVVFVAGASEGLLPHRKSIRYIDGEEASQSLEEERRLCYVAMTRAKDRLYVSSILTYMGKGLEPSRFLAEAQAIA